MDFVKIGGYLITPLIIIWLLVNNHFLLKMRYVFFHIYNQYYD
nr:MAG TPA: hypothetical protein [Caudoviricetes sp.]